MVFYVGGQPPISRDLPVHPALSWVCKDSPTGRTIVQGKELYRKIVALVLPWAVASVELCHESKEIRVQVERSRGASFRWSENDCECPIHDPAEPRRWRHLDSCQFKTVLIASTPRSRCTESRTRPFQGRRRKVVSRSFLISWPSIILRYRKRSQGPRECEKTSWKEALNNPKRAEARGKVRKTKK